MQQMLFGITAGAMFVGTALYLWLFSKKQGGTALYIVPASITVIAGVAYGVMSLSELGVIGDVVLEARYVDWVITTPLIVYTLATIAGTDPRTKGKAMAADAVMIVLGYISSVTTGAVKWAAFVASSAAFVLLLYYLVTALTESAGNRPPAVEAMFMGLRDLTVFLWLAFPLLWVVGPSGFELIQATDYAYLLAFMDLTAKAGFNLIIALRTRAVRTTLGTEYLGDLSTETA